MASEPREWYSKARENSEKGNAILHRQKQPICQRDLGRLSDYQTIHKLTYFSVVTYATLRNTCKFLVPRAKKGILKFSFFPRTINGWNSLLEGAMFVDSFKFKLFNNLNFSITLVFSPIFIIITTFQCNSSYLNFTVGLQFLPTEKCRCQTYLE